MNDQRRSTVAHGSADEPRALRPGLRLRLTAITVSVVAVPLMIGAFVLGSHFHGALTDTLRQQTASRLTTIALAVEAVGPGVVGAFDGDESIRSIVILDAAGRVITASGTSDLAAPPSQITTLSPGQAAVTGAQGAWLAFFSGQSTIVASLGIVVDGAPMTVAVMTTTSPIDATANEFTGSLLAGIPLALVITGLMTWLVVGRTLRRVENIRARVAEIARAPSELGTRVDVPPEDDEIAGLATTMNDMLTSIERARHSEIRFVADAGHELRSPLASVSAAVELAGDDGAEWREMRPIVEVELERLRRLVEALVTLGRLDDGTGAVRRVECDLGALTAGELDRARLAARSRDIRIDAHLSMATVVADPEGLTSVVRNLLDNAVRHARSTVRVDVDAHSPAWARVVVADDGEGVPLAERTRILDRFVRLDDSRTRSTGGSGLGLAIVRGIAEAHDGHVEVGEDPDLGGAAVTVLLPLAPRPTPESADPRADIRPLESS